MTGFDSAEAKCGLMEFSTNQRKMKKQITVCIATQVFSLPEEIISEILVRIAANKLLRFKSVCKSWRSLISRPSFLNSHLNHCRSQSRHQIILTTFTESSNNQFDLPFYLSRGTQQPGYYDPDVKVLSINLQHNVTVDNIPVYSPGLAFTLKASCDGLLLLHDQYRRLIVYNPVTFAYKILPSPSLVEYGGIYNFIRDHDWILFYDTGACKYKVCFFRYHCNVICHCLLLTVGEDHWSHFPYPHFLKPISPLVFLHNKLHWLTFNSRSPRVMKWIPGPDYPPSNQCLVYSMDLADFNITKTDTPIHQKDQRHLLSELNGSLCLASFSSDQLDIFVLEDFACGLWTKHYSTSLPSLSSLKSFLSEDICVVVSKDLSGCDFSSLVKIFIHDEDQLICYDFKRQEASMIGPLSKDQRLRESYQFYSATFVQV